MTPGTTANSTCSCISQKKPPCCYYLALFVYLESSDLQNAATYLAVGLTEFPPAQTLLMRHFGHLLERRKCLK